MPRLTPISANAAAFLDAIAWSEGTSRIPHSDDGYKVLVGATPGHPLLFESYTDHPKVFNRELRSTAAGRYQILYRWWLPYKARLALPDFGPVAQDRVALRQIEECGASALVEAGDFAGAVAKTASIWASLPGNSYGQHQNRLAELQTAYINAGGTVA